MVTAKRSSKGELARGGATLTVCRRDFAFDFALAFDFPYAVWPPSIVIVAPVTYEDASDAR